MAEASGDELCQVHCVGHRRVPVVRKEERKREKEREREGEKERERKRERERERERKREREMLSNFLFTRFSLFSYSSSLCPLFFSPDPFSLIQSSDDENHRTVSREEGAAFAGRHNILYFESSAARDVNVYPVGQERNRNWTKRMKEKEN